jgi:hypothetical protein
MTNSLFVIPYDLSMILVSFHYKISCVSAFVLLSQEMISFSWWKHPQLYDLSMKYLVGIFILIMIIGVFANRELARDRKRIQRLMKEYSYRTYSPEETKEEDHPEGKSN